MNDFIFYSILTMHQVVKSILIFVFFSADMNHRKMTATDLVTIVEASIDRKADQERKRITIHQQFLCRLKETSMDFMHILEDEIQGMLLEMAKRGHKRTRFQSFFQFSQHFRNLRVSTLVYGWRSPAGWDIEKFKELGFTGTPFDLLVEDFKGRGIFVKNISDSNRGFGFWIEAGILCDEAVC